jgi:dolichol-phosphate mannosyltransferase
MVRSRCGVYVRGHEQGFFLGDWSMTRKNDTPQGDRQTWLVAEPRRPHGPPAGIDCMDLSLVIPVRNEAGNIAPLVDEIRTALDGFVRYEILVVDDGGEDGTADEVQHLARTMPQLRLLRHKENCGQSAAIRSGVKAARAPWIATLDGDGQNDPADIPRLWQAAQEAPSGTMLLVNGHRRERRDNWSKRSASRIANAVRRRFLHDDTPDTGCGLKLFPRALFLDLPYFDHMHRFMPALVLREGGAVRSIPVNHRPRRRGLSKYGLFDRLGVGIVDLCGVVWLRRRAARPILVESAPCETGVAAPIPATTPAPR